MRGEKNAVDIRAGDELGSPPHARGKARETGKYDSHERITPACAGKSYIAGYTFTTTEDHPRMRGEKLFRPR